MYPDQLSRTELTCVDPSREKPENKYFGILKEIVGRPLDTDLDGFTEIFEGLRGEQGRLLRYLGQTSFLMCRITAW